MIPDSIIRTIATSSQSKRLMLHATILFMLGCLGWSGTADAVSIVQASVDSMGNDSNGMSTDAAISGDGRYVAFTSSADNLVSDDTNAQQDIFVHDMQSGETTLVNVNSLDIQANGYSVNPTISADGLYVAYASVATNLVAGDTNNYLDVFVYTRSTGETNRVSVDSEGKEGNGDSDYPTISTDGCCIAFTSLASKLVQDDTNGYRDVFVHDRRTGETTRVNVNSEGGEANDNSSSPSISGDGRYVVFASMATNLVANDTYAGGIYLHDRETGETIRVSVDSDGNPATGGDPSISANGRYVAFSSSDINLISEESNSAQDIFVHDLETGITTRVSSPLYDYDSIWYFNTPSISGDGRYVAFQFFEEALNPYDEEYYLNATGVLYQDRMTLETTTVYRTAVDFQLHNPSISADGNYVAYEASEDSGYEIFVQGPMINEPLTVTIDIAPRREPNRIIPDRGRPAVAILTDQSFDATQVDPASVRFGPAQAEPMSNRIIDVDSDGDMDQVFYFLTEQTGIACGDTEATLIGETFEGVSVSGSDAIITLGCR